MGFKASASHRAVMAEFKSATADDNAIALWVDDLCSTMDPLYKGLLP